MNERHHRKEVGERMLQERPELTVGAMSLVGPKGMGPPYTSNVVG